MMAIVIECVISYIITSSIHIKLTRVYHELIIIIKILDSIESMISNIISASCSIIGEMESHFI